jgi:hypothetical protein
MRSRFMPLMLVAAMAVSGCESQGASIDSSPEEVLIQQAQMRVTNELKNPDYINFARARVPSDSKGGEGVVCGTVSYNRDGVPSRGAERFIVFPGIVAIEGQPTTTFTFEHYYEMSGCAR